MVERFVKHSGLLSVPVLRHVSHLHTNVSTNLMLLKLSMHLKHSLAFDFGLAVETFVANLRSLAHFLAKRQHFWKFVKKTVEHAASDGFWSNFWRRF